MACDWGSTYVLDEGSLVLEGVTLAEMVELVVEVLVNLAAGAVLDQETAEDSLASHPEDLTVESCQKKPIRPKSGPLLSPCPRHSEELRVSNVQIRSKRNETVRKARPTRACERWRYPSSYRSPGGGRLVGRGSAPGHATGSAS